MSKFQLEENSFRWEELKILTFARNLRAIGALAAGDRISFHSNLPYPAAAPALVALGFTANPENKMQKPIVNRSFGARAVVERQGESFSSCFSSNGKDLSSYPLSQVPFHNF